MQPCRCPPEPEDTSRKPKPRPIEFPEDRFIQSFYDRYPQVRQMPMDLHSKEPPLARQYALRALELWQGGRTPKEARRIADREFQRAGLLTAQVRDDRCVPAGTSRHMQPTAVCHDGSGSPVTVYRAVLHRGIAGRRRCGTSSWRRSSRCGGAWPWSPTTSSADLRARRRSM